MAVDPRHLRYAGDRDRQVDALKAELAALREQVTEAEADQLHACDEKNKALMKVGEVLLRVTDAEAKGRREGLVEAAKACDQMSDKALKAACHAGFCKAGDLYQERSRACDDMSDELRRLAKQDKEGAN